MTWYDRRRHRTKRFATKREAQVFQGELARGQRAQDRSALVLEDWWSRWLVEHGIEWSPRTRRDRAWYGDKHVLPYLGHLRLVEVEKADIRRWRSELVAAGASPYTVNTATTILSAALGDAAEDGHLLANPALGFRKLRRVVDPVRPPSVEHVEVVRARLEQPRDRLVVSLMAYAGLRPGEVCALTWAQISAVGAVVPPPAAGVGVQLEGLGPALPAGPEAGLADQRGAEHADLSAVPQALGAGVPEDQPRGLGEGVHERGRVTLVVSRARSVGGIKGTKTSANRTVPLLQPVADDLAAAVAPEPALAGEPGGHDRNPVHVEGAALVLAGGWDNWTGRVWRPACREVGLSIRPYDLRHLCASLLIQEGRLGLAEIAAQMGHSIAMLTRTYAHVIEGSTGLAGQPLDEVVLRVRHRLSQ